MSVKQMGLVWDLDLPHNKAWVLMAMLDHADHDGERIFPGVDLIAWKTGYAPRQVQRIIKALVDDGILEVVAEARQHRPTEYRARLDHVPRKTPLRPSRDDKMSPLNKPSGDKMSPLPPSRDDKMSPIKSARGDILSARGDILSARGDIAMSPEPPVEPSCDPPPPPTPSPAPGGGGGNGKRSPAPPPGAAYLVGEGFGDWAVSQFGHMPVEVLAADVARYRAMGKKTGGIVNAWKVCPPGSAPPPGSAAPPPRASAREISEADVPGNVRAEWLRKFRAADPPDRPAVLARFRTEVLASHQGAS